MFHRFRAEVEAGLPQGEITAPQLEGILDHVGAANILPPEEWLRRVRGGRLGATDLCLTFDDGLRSQVAVALPVLERRGLRAFWFVYTCVLEGDAVPAEIYHRFIGSRFPSFGDFYAAFVELCGARSERLEQGEFLDWAGTMKAQFPFYSTDELKYRYLRNRILSLEEFNELMSELMLRHGFDPGPAIRDLWLSEEDLRGLAGEGHEIGLHSHDHPFELARLPVEGQRRQYERNRDHLRRISGRDVRSASHPLNSYGQDTLAVLSEMGIECGFRSNMTPPHGKSINPGPLEFAREDGGTLMRLIARAPVQGGRN